MTKEKQEQTTCSVLQAGSTVWCGPSLAGVAAHFELYTQGLPAALSAFIEAHAEMGALLVPLTEFPQARKALASGEGHMSALDRMARDYTTRE